VTVLIILKYVDVWSSSLVSYLDLRAPFSFTDWFFFMVLDIGNPAIDYIPLGIRFLIGLLQAVAVRAGGFGLVALSTLAPAVKCDMSIPSSQGFCKLT
jgi:Trk-type K+ transport system membrane component